ncbi:MAG: hypothetical protein RLZZ627_2087 [Pseudomonadota bacterium]|jgi:mono/diheme cytochrome c family protein
MKHKAHLFTRLLGGLALALATSVSAEDRTTTTPSISPSSQTISAKVGQAIKATAAYAARNFGGTPSYSISPALPQGLGLSASNGVITGTPQVAATQANYTVTAKYGTKSAKATVTVTVTQTSGSASLTPPSQVVVATVGKAISTSALEAANFGTASVSYSIQPSPPAGLTLNTSTGSLSGTPTVATAQSSYVVTGQSSSAQATASITLTVVQGGGSTTPTSGLNCPDAAQAATETAAIQGRRAYLRLNCYSCHGDYAQGGTMGPNVQGEGGDVAEALRGDGGMPSFTSALCPNDASNLSAYLNSVKSLYNAASPTSSAPQLLDWKTYPGNQFTSTPSGLGHFH